ncbi:hypothetical protein IVB12_11360 [Bradyrhizobium sp. 179]|uniref:hypothetical protein n=1 Tax=Bradyrhizobium sp. 179 TaxID=2782648 RepID=UPI001FF94CAE|nr:hypothetical protein [Bradyrhizobium sp. 179]MCK1542528.1 hypothetical protein [Bradyrhizobium sp. 179]
MEITELDMMVPMLQQQIAVTEKLGLSTDRAPAAHDSERGPIPVVINKLVERDALPKDENARQNVMAFAKERIAQHLENGHSFLRAKVMLPVRDRHPSEGDKEIRIAQTGERPRMRERER